jgi:hypothetical protein
MFFRGVWYVSVNILAPASGHIHAMLFLSRNNFPRNKFLSTATLVRRSFGEGRTST